LDVKDVSLRFKWNNISYAHHSFTINLLFIKVSEKDYTQGNL